MCVLSIKVPIWKKSGNLFNDPRTYGNILFVSTPWRVLGHIYSSFVMPFWLFPKLRGCRYETIEEMKEAVTKVIYTLTQEDFHGVFQKLLEPYKCIAAGGDYFEGD